MFLEQYQLETNPFEFNQVRPRLESRSTRSALLKLEQAIDGRVHCLFLSGPAGVGKSTLAGRRLRGMKDATVCWVNAGANSREEFLVQVLSALGLSSMEGTLAELRNIIEVFLQHQAGKDRRSVLVADGLERLSVPVLREIEWLSSLRLRNRPVMQFVLLTRNEDLVPDFMPSAQGTQLAACAHQRLTGFDLEEIGSYLRACLPGAENLISNEIVVDIQAFTHGIVRDINALCFEALNLLAAQAGDKRRQPRLSRTLIKEAAKKLNLKYDPAAAQLVEEALSPESVQQSDPAELQIEAARLFVSSGGKIVAEVSLNRPRIVLGRDEGCDISLDSSYVSRFQNLFMETPEGWMLIDLNSTNGCFVNGHRVHEHKLQDGDVIAVGHHQLRFVSQAHGTLKRLDTGAILAIAPREVTPLQAETRVSERLLGQNWS